MNFFGGNFLFTQHQKLFSIVKKVISIIFLEVISIEVYFLVLCIEQENKYSIVKNDKYHLLRGNLGTLNRFIHSRGQLCWQHQVFLYTKYHKSKDSPPCIKVHFFG